MIPIRQIPTTLVTGFLGAGKTTLINALIAHKSHQKWALLINEFGKIGIDGALVAGDDIAIKEVNGGCICCTGQLPLQVALVRLINEHHPDRLIIEPTGLAHPDELLDQLSEPHWQTTLRLNAVICVLSAPQWQQEKYRTHDGYIAHVRHADIVFINRHDALSDHEQQALRAWITSINERAVIIDEAPLSQDTAGMLLSTPHDAQKATQRISLRAPNSAMTQTADETIKGSNELPYRYHEQMAGHQVGGWRLPSTWQFDSYHLQKWLLSRPNYLRIKGVVHTLEGWLLINITPESISITDTTARDDSKIELIFDAKDAKDDDWQVWDDELMNLVQTMDHTAQ
ncbi:CobW family GTP-binding protein [Moraxella catarrhalis]|nr:GTP-binding protein [Moraxella catarrhalis]